MKRISTILLAVMLFVGMYSSTAFGAGNAEYYTDENGAKTAVKTVTIDPYTYYDIGGGKKVDVNVGFLSKAVKDEMISKWAPLASALFETTAKAGLACNDDDDDLSFESRFKFTGEDSESSSRIDLTKWLSSTDSGHKGDSESNAFRSGVCMANSLSAVRQALGDAVAEHSHAPGKISGSRILSYGKNDDDGALPLLNDSENKNTDQKVIYQIVTSQKKKNTGNYYYAGYGIAFYDFDLTILSDSDLEYVTAAEKYGSIEAAAEAGAPGVKYDGANGSKAVSYTENASKEDVEVSMGFENSQSTSLTTSIENSEEYTFSQMIGLETEFQTKAMIQGVTQHLSFEFTAEEAYSTVRGKEDSVEKSTTNSLSTTVVIPAHTAIGIQQEDSKATIELAYDTPVALSYKVAIFGLSGEYYSAAATDATFDTSGYEHAYFSTIFGGDSENPGYSANEALYNRAVKYYDDRSYENAYGKTDSWWKNSGGSSGTESTNSAYYPNWESVSAKLGADDLKELAVNVPMVSAGSSMKVEGKSIASSIHGVEPLYKLAGVKLASGSKSYEIMTDEEFNLENLSVCGYNRYGVPYYGFNEDDGEWICVDSEGQPAAGTAATVSTDSNTGEALFSASEAGTYYIKWVLNENAAYDSRNDSGKIRREDFFNGNVETAAVKIKVSDVPFTGTVRLDGSYTGYVGEDVQLGEYLTPVIEDSTGKEIDRPVIWEQQELVSKGLSVTSGGSASFTKPGTFHVRVKVRSAEDYAFSNWAELTVLPKKELSDITISDSETDPVLTEKILGDAGTEVDLGKLLIAGKDQYGNTWDMTSESIVWTADGNEISGSTYTPDKAGDIKIAVKCGELRSNELTLTVKPKRALDTLTIESSINDSVIGLGNAYAVDLSEVTITAKDQYGEDYDYSADTLTWTTDKEKNAVVDGGKIVGRVVGKSELTLAIGDVSSNKISFDVEVKPFVKELYSLEGNVVTEGTAADLNAMTLKAKDQYNEPYAMSDKELASVAWSISEDGTIGSGSAVLDETARTLTVSEGTLGYGETGTVVMDLSFTNVDGSAVNGKATITVKQKPILDQISLAQSDPDKLLSSGENAYCYNFFTTAAKDQYGEDYALSETCTWGSDNEDAIVFDNTTGTITAKKSGESANVTVSAVNSTGATVTSNECEVKVRRVPTIESIDFGTVPEQVIYGEVIDLSKAGTLCFDDLGEAFSEEALKEYPAEVRYVLEDTDGTGSVLDEKGLTVTAGDIDGYITLKAEAVKSSTKTVATNKSGEEITASVKVLIGPKVVTYDKTSVVMRPGTSGTVKAKVTPTQYTDTLKYTSSDTSVAKVDGSGKITAVGAGVATITAQSGSDSAVCKVTVGLKKGQSYSSGLYKYKVTDDRINGYGTLAVKGFAKGKFTGKVVIPETVAYRGIKYKVTAVSDHAFKAKKGITSVKIGSNVKTIGVKAFREIGTLKEVVIGKNVVTIKKHAFCLNKNLKKVKIKSKKLKTAGKPHIFLKAKSVKVYVPKSKYAAYKKLLSNRGAKKIKIVKF